jgi:hypothetical protein
MLVGMLMPTFFESRLLNVSKIWWKSHVFQLGSLDFERSVLVLDLLTAVLWRQLRLFRGYDAPGCFGSNPWPITFPGDTFLPSTTISRV